jgi:hypothetical protein
MVLHKNTIVDFELLTFEILDPKVLKIKEKIKICNFHLIK